MNKLFTLPKTLDVPYPALLTHPNIPKPLHGLNPRTLLGRKWWDEQRKAAYATYGFRCWACGISKYDAAYHQWLEGHEHYDIDYEAGKAELSEIVALCHCCHNFVHSGRMIDLVRRGTYDIAKARFIINRGVDILRMSNLEPFWYTLIVQAELNEGPFDSQAVLEIGQREEGNIAEWSKWHLVIGDEAYPTPYASFDDWLEKYYDEGE